MLVAFSAAGGEGSLPLRGAPAFLSYKPGRDLDLRKMAILFIFPFGPNPAGQKRAQRRLRQICLRHAMQNCPTIAPAKSTNWSKHKQDVIEWQIIGPKHGPPGETWPSMGGARPKKKPLDATGWGRGRR